MAVAAVSDLARREGVTPFMAVLGAFQALLARWTGEAVIPVGTAVANRRRPEVERLIGLFVNSLVLAVPVGDDPAFGDLLARVRQACLGAYAHQDLPFERLVEELRPSRDLGQNPLFQVMLVFEEPLPARRAGGLVLEPVRGGASGTGTAKLDLLLAVSPRLDGSWELLAEHAAALWEPATIDRLLGHFQTLLGAVTAAANAADAADAAGPGRGCRSCRSSPLRSASRSRASGTTRRRISPRGRSSPTSSRRRRRGRRTPWRFWGARESGSAMAASARARGGSRPISRGSGFVARAGWGSVSRALPT